MKTIFRKSIISALVAFLGLALMPISSVLAQAENSQRPTMEEKKADRKEKVNDKFCTAIENNSGKFLENWEQKGNNLKMKKEERKNRWTERVGANSARLTELRSKVDAEMAKKIADLLAKTGITDAQKSAVNTFSATQKTALTKKRAAIDAARNTFQVGVANAVNTKQAGMDAVMATFKNSISAAFGKAKTDCTASVEIGSVRETLRASLKTAREKMQTDKEANAKLKVSIEPLVEARKTAFETARNTYKTTMEAARTTLQAAFPDGTVDLPIE
jgi:nitrate reductase assembly molybdenum cofactor insertion protein NarJ